MPDKIQTGVYSLTKQILLLSPGIQIMGPNRKSLIKISIA